MEINDTLKFKAYGWKKDYEQKRPHIEKVYQEHRQYYPEDSHGVIDEWQALIRNQAEVYQQDERVRKEQEYQNRVSYKEELDRQMKEKEFRDQAGRQKDNNNNHLYATQLEQQIKNMEHNDKMRLNDEYQRMLEENKRKAHEAKQRDLIEDQNMLDRDRLRDRDSKRAQKDKNSKYKKDLDDAADYYDYLKNQLSVEQNKKEDEDYLLGCQRDNEKRDKEKDDWYKKYKKISEDMDDRVKTTLAQGKPALDRQNHINQMINNSVDTYGNKMFDDYEKGRDHMKTQWMNAYNDNQRNLKDKNRDAHMGKLKDKQAMEDNDRNALAFNQDEEQRLRDMEEQRNLYRETLQNQMSLNALGKHNYGKMTMQEKHMNKPDLRSYKNKERNIIHSLIPGISNIPSVGAKPFRRGGLSVMEMGDSPKAKRNERKGQMFFSPNARAPEGLMSTENYQNPLPHQSGIVRNKNQSFGRTNTPPGSMFHGGPVSKTDFEKYKNGTTFSRNSGLNTTRNAYSMASICNPIVNPVDKSYKIFQH